MKTLFSSFVIFLFINISAFSDSLCIVPEEVYTEVSNLVLECHYRDAERILDSFIDKYPNEPAGPLLKAVVLQYEFTDYEDFSRDEEFFYLLDSAEHCAEKILRVNNDDVWAQYFLSASKSIRGVWLVSSGDFLKGIVKGRSGAKGMSDIISRNSNFYDAYLMLGSYTFWKSVAIEPFHWMPFIEDKRKDGIAKVEQAITHGKFTGPLSNIVLLEMLLEFDTALAVRLGEKMVKQYPSCRLFFWQLGEAYKKIRRYNDAVRIFTKIAESMAHDEVDDGAGELRCWWKLAVLSKSVENKSECLYYCNKVIKLGEQDSVYKKQYKRINKAIEMMKELKDE